MKVMMTWRPWMKVMMTWRPWMKKLSDCLKAILSDCLMETLLD